MRLAPFAQLAPAALVCSQWRDAARGERKLWRICVQQAMKEISNPTRQAIVKPIGISSTDFVHRCCAIAECFGLQIARCGLAGCLGRCFEALGLLDSIADAQMQHDLRSSSEPAMTWVAKPDGDALDDLNMNAENNSSQLILISRAERVPHCAGLLAEILASGLIVLNEQKH